MHDISFDVLVERHLSSLKCAREITLFVVLQVLGKIVLIINVIMELFCHVGLRYVVECFRHAVLVPGFYLILMFLSVSGIQTSNLCVIIIL